MKAGKSEGPALLLKAGREKSLLRRHPWVFSGGIERVLGQPGVGETVAVRDARGAFLAWAAYSPHSQISARVWSFDAAQRIGPDLIRHRLQQALSLRARCAARAADEGERLVHAESDGLPGVVVDRFGQRLVVQLNSAGAHAWRDCIADTLVALTGIAHLHERSDGDVLEQEGLAPVNAMLRGESATRNESTTRSDSTTITPFQENGLTFLADAGEGHKTGFYLDQRENRALLRAHARDAEVLDCFCYTGGFTVNALAGGARSVTAVDASQPALDQAGGHLRRNALDDGRASFVCDDVFALLRRYRDAARQFDIIVLDPPKFAPRAAFAERAARGYKDINLLAFKLLRPGGLLYTFSCSGGIAPDLFQKIVAGAALDAGADARIVQRLAASPDHPVALNFPEGEYLKGLMCMKL